MKKLVCMTLGLCMCIGLFAGCGTDVEGDSSVVYVGKKGEVISLDVEQFEEDYYDVEELEAFVKEQVSAYTEENGRGTVKVEELTVADGSGRLRMRYKTPEDYSAFNGIELYQGTVLGALTAGYVFDDEYAKVENGKVTGIATKQEIYQQQDLNVVIIRANTDVQVDGEICYVSNQNVMLTGTDRVSIRQSYSFDSVEAENAAASTEQEESDSVEITAEIAADDFIETEVYSFILYN